MKNTITLILAVAAFAMPRAVLANTLQEQKKPNVLLIVVDDLGWKDLSVQGSVFYETPHIDQLAADGVRFTNGYASCQVCSPSRASLMTGQYPARMKTTDWFGAKAGTDWKRNTKLLPAEYIERLDHDRTTVAEAFKESGYSTFFAGKWHLGKDEGDWPEHHGFDINIGGNDKGSPPGGFFSPHNNPRLKERDPGEYLPLRLADETANFILNSGEKPFFATLCFYAVHAPLQTTHELWDKYRKKAESLPQPTSRMEVERRRPIRVVQDNPIYGGLMEAMDAAVGRVLEALDEAGQRENTIVIFTSDHGGVSSGDHWATSNLPLRGGKGYQWEGGLRVPFIVSWPGNIQPSVNLDTPVIGTDVYPTLLELAGLPARPEEHVDGTSIVPALRGGRIPDRPLFWHYPHYGNQGGDPSSVVQLKGWKLIRYHEGDPDELFYLPDDPMESRDLAQRYPEKARELRGILDQWLADVDAEFPTINPDFDEVAFAREQVRKVEVMLPMREKQAAEILEPDWSPDATWWGSETVD
ncbi:sulfatase [Pelagicoccus enzymogenes]|uniref:sulfatase n=1 Tax=Pelagicoccus enzymogenes TaxID=2773457 RepID=UPI00280D7FE1|nr:sulfatase [Pelagicoccus enzymogenes]MDQ8198628.1 sulfatase [Pelagicoccus enzymogenes]